MLSVIIPTENDERALVPTLAALIPGASAGLIREVIVADAGSTDATADVADLAGAAMLVSRAARGARLKEAARTARAAWLLFLRPNIVLDLTWIAEVARFVEESERDARLERRAAVFRPASMAARRSTLAEALALLRAALGGRPRPEQGLLIARRFYDELGGHRTDAADAEADLLARLGRRRTVLLRSGAVNVATT
jgi:hypothetical protein